MKIINDYPPNYDEICKVFSFVKGKKDIVFTYGDTIYAPGKKRAIPNHLKVHERTHTKQQGDNPSEWWERYLANKEFRLKQEVEAYKKQYQFFIAKNHNLEEQAVFLDNIAQDLAGPMYGNLIRLDLAKALIKN